jgi:hypothetical protein
VEATQPLTAARSCRKTGIFGQPVSEGVAAMSPTSFPFRRDFLRYVGLASSLTIGSGLFAMQARHKFPDPPRPAEPNSSSAKPGDLQAAQRAQLKLNEKEFRESLANLYQRVSELKQDMEATHTTEVFSVKVYKQTGEIEHLAKKLRSLAKI